jgi:microcystin-dependent protein
MKALAIFVTMPLAAIPVHAAFAAASPTPIDNLQPSLALNELMVTNGVFPIGGSGMARGDTLGFVYDFAGGFTPHGAFPARGQFLPISSYSPLFSLLGATYGGDGLRTFALPNLQGSAIIGAGSGAGLSPRPLGSVAGSPSVTLTSAEVPKGAETSALVPYNTVQPSLALEPLIAVNSVYPLSGSGPGPAAFMGQIAYFAGNFVPAGWELADGQTLSIASNPALFTVIGTTYGGNGITTFQLPDLVGRIAIGADAANPLGSVKGSETVDVTRSDLPGAGEQPVSNDQPSLAVNYLIARSGVFPSTSGGGFGPSTATIGEIVPYAGETAPEGWMFANGQMLPINEYSALFSVLGATYGGDGIRTFALPDLDGRTVIGDSSLYPEGDAVGTDNFRLTSAELPAETAVPEPATWAMMALGFAAMGFFALRRGHAAPAVA